MLGVALLASALLAGSLPRAEVDRPDEALGPSLHVIYAVPRDGQDRGLDTSGALASSVAAFETWLAGETGGSNLRLDTFSGELDVTFVRLQRSDAELAARGAFVRDEIEAELTRRRLIVSAKVYAVYYDGSSSWSCGGGAWPPRLPGRVAAMYLKGEPPGAPPCATNSLAGPGAPPGYFEFAMLHEILHTLGFAAACAPHHTLAGHVSDSPNDLMWAGDAAWQLPSRLDIGGEDYYGHGRSDCPDLARSEYLTSFVPRFRVVALHVTRVRRERVLHVRMRIGANGEQPPTANVACTAHIGRKTLKTLARSYVPGAADCRWRLPVGARGTLRGSIAVTAWGQTVRRTFATRVR